MSEQVDSGEERKTRSPLRRAGLLLSLLLSLYVGIVAVYQIFSVALFPPGIPTSHSCASGTRALHEAVTKAAAAVSSAAPPNGDSIASFRHAIETDWREASSIREVCEAEKNMTGLEALGSVEMLRYSEERLLRTSAPHLTKLKKRTLGLLNQLDSSN